MSHQPVLYLADQMSAYGATQSDTLVAHLSAGACGLPPFQPSPQLIQCGPWAVAFAYLFHLCGVPPAFLSHRGTHD